MSVLSRDLTDPRWLTAKGLMFVIAAAGSTALVVALAMMHGDWRLLLGAHVVGVWCACRAYYFAFYVLERYAGGGRYAGLFAAILAGLKMIARRNR